MFPGRLQLDPGMYAVLGAAAFFGGTLRCTVSICVIVLEMVDAAEALPLLMLALIIAKVRAPLATRKCRLETSKKDPG